MSEQYTNPLNYLLDSLWASMPEKTADELATFKKDVLIGFRDGVNWLVDEQIKCTEQRLENARRMREQYRKRQEPETGEAPPNPA